MKGKDGHCKKCGARKLTEKIHHCSRCNMCVDRMDHHCFFTDNCVSKKTYKSFVLFCLYTISLCIYGVSHQIYFMYTKNVESGICFQGIGDYLFYPPNSMSFDWYHDKIPYLYLKSYVCFADYYCLIGSLGFLAIATIMLTGLLSNLKKN